MKLPDAYVIDSFAWIEYFLGTAAGHKALGFIESDKGITPTIVIAELAAKYRRDRLPIAADLNFIIAKTRIAPLNTEIAERAGSLSSDRKQKVKRWGLADSIVLATAREYGAKVVTGDEHFRDLADETEMIS